MSELGPTERRRRKKNKRKTPATNKAQEANTKRPLAVYGFADSHGAMQRAIKLR